MRGVEPDQGQPDCGSAEIACSLKVFEEADKMNGLEQYSMWGFADALMDVPLALAENIGLEPVATVINVQARQLAEKNPFLGVDCMAKGTEDMKEQKVFETLKGKQQQLMLATQVRRPSLHGNGSAQRWYYGFAKLSKYCVAIADCEDDPEDR